jgi:hypothetical protein
LQEDADGGYGSAAATRAVVKALLASAPASAGSSQITVSANGMTKTVEIAGSGRVVVALPANASRATITVLGAPIVARLERPVIRLWSHTIDEAPSALHLDVTWPDAPRAGKNGVVHLSLRQALARTVTVDARLALPPGVTLAAAIDGVSLVQGKLSVRRKVEPSRIETLVEIPVRFALAGAFTVPEASAKVAFEEQPRALAPARPLVVR